MTTQKPSTAPQPREAERERQDRRPAETRETAKKPRDEDMPGADGLRSARADEDTYD